ncbi:hypothetical protein [Natronincola ferrireducens]|uniref:RNA dependent RNA polymerase n=1 Tax=Natronincola ferrireducens TaxID=393762 RepID=A0A1G9IG97_9FIRM|nr:hypothetical protein [Natronincola ferrireducens]SDL23843.1 hypothetical protein SAMN05660472_02853 [Natronincola ferrireducens]
MMKLKGYKIYSFDRSHIKDGVIESSDLHENETTISDNFLTHAIESYKQQELKDQELITEIIKVMLPQSEDKAKEEWFDGLEFQGSKYYGWFATTGGMKQEKNGICETIFVREDFRPFIEEFEDLISLGKFKEIEESKDEICINKDILSRISLATSSSFIAGDMPNFIVLPQASYHIIKDYKTVEKVTKKVEDEEGKEESIIDYNLVDYYHDKEIEVFDGGGIATPQVFKQIQRSLKINYPVEFAIIRAYGIGIKGMITKFDIVEYLRKTYKGETKYCRIKNGNFELLDRWDEWQPVTKNTILLNESMVKLAKYFKGMEEYKKKLDSVEEKYKGIISKLYVTKINKADSEITDYRRLNYQILTALALSYKDYIELAQEDVKAYRKILKAYVKDENNQWKIDIDTIRLFFKNIVKMNSDDKDEEDFEKMLQEPKNIATKVEELLSISEDFVKLKYVRNGLARLIEKKCREVCCGKITCKAKYQYIAIDPISYMNFAMYRNQGENGLGEEEFYSADCQDGDMRTVARNPLCAYSEIHNVKFVRSESLDKWLSPCRELIYFNQKSDILALMSSADCDGDACTVIDNKIIKNAVVIPKDGKYFINPDDGHKEEMAYNNENRFIATYRAAGNLIGNIALKSASINSNSQQTLDYYDTESKQFGAYSMLEIETEYEKKTEEYKKLKNEYIREKKNSGEWIDILDASEQHREHIRHRFYENEKDIYIVLYNAMVAIDAPKTLYFPSPEDMKIINDKYARKAKFLQYKENSEDIDNRHYIYTWGLLDKVAGNIKGYLLDEIDDIVMKWDNRVDLIQQKLINGEYDHEKYNGCLGKVEVLYKNYTEEREEANKECLKKIKKENKYRHEMMELHKNWSQWEEDEHWATVRRYKEDKYNKFKEIDAKYILEAEKIFTEYDLPTISNAIANVKPCTEDFIINLFFSVFKFLNDTLRNDRYVYVKDPEGDIHYLYDNYKKIPIKNTDNDNIVKMLHLEEKKRLKAIDIMSDKFRCKPLDMEVIDIIENGKEDITFDIAVKENQVILIKDDIEYAKVFPDSKYIQYGEHSLFNCSQLTVANILKGKVSDKSIGLILKSIAINE